MINFADPSRWLVVQYKPGCGGKFLIIALTTIDRVASWEPKVQIGDMDWKDYVDGLWNTTDENDWMDTEPEEPWGLGFFSRTMSRGRDLSIDSFNNLASHSGSKYFFSIYEQNLIYIDFCHGLSLPKWWQDAKVVKLDAKLNDPIWKEQILKKVCIWNEQNKIGSKIIDKPWSEDCMEARYNNQWQFTNFDNKDTWLNWAIGSDDRLNYELTNPDIYLNDLFDFNCLNNHVKKIAKSLDSPYNIDNLRYLYEHWVGKH